MPLFQKGLLVFFYRWTLANVLTLFPTSSEWIPVLRKQGFFIWSFLKVSCSHPSSQSLLNHVWFKGGSVINPSVDRLQLAVLIPFLPTWGQLWGRSFNIGHIKPSFSSERPSRINWISPQEKEVWNKHCMNLKFQVKQVWCVNVFPKPAFFLVKHPSLYELWLC